MRTQWENKFKVKSFLKNKLLFISFFQSNSFKNFSYEKFLQIEIIVLPDINEKNEEKILTVKDRIKSVSSPNFFLKNLNESIYIPSESMPIYLQSSYFWILILIKLTLFFSLEPGYQSWASDELFSTLAGPKVVDFEFLTRKL